MNLEEISNAANLFDDLLELERLCFTKTTGERARYSYLSFELEESINNRGNNYPKEFEAAKADWLGHSAILELGASAQFSEAARIFKRKAIMSIPDWGLPHSPAESETLEQALGSARPLSCDQVLAGITIKSLAFYDRANTGLADSLVYPSKASIEKVCRLTDRLITEIENDPFLMQILSKRTSGLQFMRSEADFNSWIETRHAWRKRFALYKKHDKAGRELFIRHIGAHYRKHFAGFDLRDATPELETTKTCLRPGNVAIGEKVIIAKKAPVHDDVIAALTALIDPDISERKVRDILSKQRAREDDLYQKGRRKNIFHALPSGREWS